MKFGDILKGKESEGNEKHVPIIDIYKGCCKECENAVRVIIGKDVPHPNTVEHHICWIELYGVKNDGHVIDLGRSTLAPVYTKSNARFKISVEEFEMLYALSYCNIHGLWEGVIR